ncbi:MAG: hydrogenase maturation protease [Myxococcota bacterium]|jgi:hydrogenase maturation protease|nr:hydrogenase maturation protease [Myxococcota bacterium]
MTAEGKVLIFGFGNPGRLDDGLGPAFAQRMEQETPAGVTVDCDYQLNVEDASTVAQHELVLFVDAAEAGPEPFWLNRLEPVTHLSFSSHSVKPDALLGMARDVLGKTPSAFILGIRGYEFNEFGERLSEQAASNLEAALDFVRNGLCSGDIGRYLKQNEHRYGWRSETPAASMEGAS